MENGLDFVAIKKILWFGEFSQDVVHKQDASDNACGHERQAEETGEDGKKGGFEDVHGLDCGLD